MVSTTQTPTKPAATLRRRRRRRLSRLTRRDKLVAALLLGIPLLLDLAFVWLPALASVLLSFTKWTGVGGVHLKACTNKATLPGIPQPGCIFGVQNYHQAFTVYPDFWPAVRHNAIWLGVFIVFATPLGMLFAVIIDRGIRGSRIYQSVLFLPVMLSLALIGILWEFVYSPDVGLKAVDPGLREAALVDGANTWQTFWRVVFPVLRPINVVILVVTVIESLRAFDLVYITSKGNPLRGLELLSISVTQNIVGETQRIGFGSTLGVVLLVISLVPISIFLYQVFRREER